MDPIKLSLFFALGVFLQGVLFMLYSGGLKKFLLLTLGALALSSFGILMAPDGIHQLFAAIVIFILAFCTSLTYFFKAGILKVINERYLLFINIVFVYFMLSSNSPGKLDELQGVIYMYLIGSTLFTFLNAFTPTPLTRFKKIYLYVWLIFMSSIMLSKDIVLWAQADFSVQPELYTPFAVFIKGMSSCLLFSYLLYLIFFFYAGQINFEKELKLSKKHPTLKNIICKRFSDEQVSRLEAALIIVIGGGALALNHVLHLVPYQLLTSILIIVLPFIAPKK